VFIRWLQVCGTVGEPTRKTRCRWALVSLYVTQGVFLLLASRDPLANRGVITFAAWLNIAHAGVMTFMSIHLPNERQDLLVASAVFAVIGVVLIALTPAKQPVERASGVVA
jgi:quinol-cytochrome oxidoreductase complex cytochrome b subunit